MKKHLILWLLILALITAGCMPQPGQETEHAATLPSVNATTESAQLVSTDPQENTAVTTTAAAPEPATTEAPETEIPTTEAPVGLEQNCAFTEIAGSDCDAAILGVLYNAPFVDGNPMPTQVWNEGEYDQLVIYPRWVGSEVSVWRILHVQDEETQYERLDGPVYSSVCQQGDSFGAALDRPEGETAWAVKITAPNGTSAVYALQYNGRYGTYAYEYLADNSVPVFETLDMDILSELIEIAGSEAVSALMRAAEQTGKSPWEVMNRYCSNFSDRFGDSMCYTICQGEMEGDSYCLEAALMHENYDPYDGSVAERAAYQAALYAEIGNDLGILGPGREGGEALHFDLDGLSVYNPTLLAQEVTITVNDIEIGTFDLTEGDFITFLDVCVGELSAESAVRVEVKVTESRGDPNAAILEVWPGMGGNISGAR